MKLYSAKSPAFEELIVINEYEYGEIKPDFIFFKIEKRIRNKKFIMVKLLLILINLY